MNGTELLNYAVPALALAMVAVIGYLVAQLMGRAKREKELAERMAGDSSDALLREYDRLTADFERLGGYNVDFERDRVANGLDIPADMRARLFKGKTSLYLRFA